MAYGSRGWRPHVSSLEIEKIRDNCALLTHGWQEKIEYKVPVTYHTTGCEQNVGCTCPVTNEARARTVKHPGLLNQLEEFQQHRDSDRGPRAERGAPHAGGSRPPGELGGFLTLDEIVAEVYTVVDRVLDEGGRDRSYAACSIRDVLNGLAYQMEQIERDRPDLVHDIIRATDRWVAKAKASLRLTVASATLADTVCGNCGGGLVVAWDNSTDVACAGTPAAPPCGETYPMSEWLSLYERGRRAG